MNIFFDLLPHSGRITALLFDAAQHSELPDPCCSEPPWVLSYHRAHHADCPVLLLFSHGNAVCFTEVLVDGRLYLFPLESSWMYDRPLLGPDPLPLFFRALTLLDERYQGKPFPPIVLGGIWPHSPFANELLLRLAHDFTFFCVNKTVQCAASLEGGVDTFLGNRSANFRQKLKKARRKADALGITLERHSPTTVEEAHALYERMLALEAKSWKGKEEDGLLHPSSTQFYRLLLEELAKYAKARVIFARHEGRDVGMIFGGCSNGIYRGQQFSYDQDYAPYSIGNILQFAQICWLTEEHVQRYDMGPITGPRMEYKHHWTEQTFPLEAWLMLRT